VFKHAFTLLEMMLVIFLLAAAATFIVPTVMRADTPQAQQAAERFYGLLTQLRDRAQIAGQVTGIQVENRRYRFMHYAQGAWRPAALPRAAAEVVVPQGVTLTLRHGAKERGLTLYEVQLEPEQPARFAPQVWFSPHEPPAPFTVQFRQQQPRACQEVSLSVSGDIHLQPCAEEKA